MKHPSSWIRLITSEETTILSEYSRTWEEYHGTLRRFRELMDESPANLEIEVFEP